MSYATLTEAKAALGISDTNDDTHLQRVLDAATKWIESPYGAGRVFGTAATATKYLYPSEDGTLDVTDLVTITTIKTDTKGDRTYGTTLASTEYELLPYNETQKQRVRIWPQSSKSFNGARLVEIVGTWGYASAENADGVPNAIKEACLHLAVRWFKKFREAPFGVLAQPELGAFTTIVHRDPALRELIAAYRRPALDWIAA